MEEEEEEVRVWKSAGLLGFSGARVPVLHSLIRNQKVKITL